MSDQNPLDDLSRAGRINRRAPQEPETHKTWWETSRRKFIIGGTALAVTGAALWGGVALLSGDDTSDVDKDSLELQKSSGWNVGSEEKRLTLTGAQTADSQGGENWRRYLEQSALLSAYQPKSAQWMPFFVPTLIQSLQFETLRNQLSPVFMPDMREAYGRGQTIAKEFLTNAENAGETAIIVDLPGRDSIAFGAGMADAAHLVTIFDNFPHPLGVTPSHETLGAMLYYAGEIESKQGSAPANAPVVFLLDSNRLAAYKDADAQFDNRYLAKLPSAQKFGEMNVKSIIYITPDRTRAEELDDLNEDFVEYKNKNINVAMLPLSDFTQGDPNLAGASGGGTWSNTGGQNYYYGGSPASHMFFFYSYPFYRPYPMYYNRYPNYSSETRSPSFRPPVTPPRYLPAARPTVFSGTRIGGASGVGRSKPSGFGRSTVRVSPSGSVVGTRAGRSGFYSPGRSGSFGRGGGVGGG